MKGRAQTNITRVDKCAGKEQNLCDAREVANRCKSEGGLLAGIALLLEVQAVCGDQLSDDVRVALFRRNCENGLTTAVLDVKGSARAGENAAELGVAVVGRPVDGGEVEVGAALAVV